MYGFDKNGATVLDSESDLSSIKLPSYSFVERLGDGSSFYGSTIFAIVSFIQIKINQNLHKKLWFPTTARTTPPVLRLFDKGGIVHALALCMPLFWYNKCILQLAYYAMNRHLQFASIVPSYKSHSLRYQAHPSFRCLASSRRAVQKGVPKPEPVEIQSKPVFCVQKYV
jgi:hypothetical protein